MMNEPYTFPAIVTGLAFVFVVWVVIGYVLPEFFRHRKEVRGYPRAEKTDKKSIKKDLDYLLKPDDMPTFTGRVELYESEKAISN